MSLPAALSFTRFIFIVPRVEDDAFMGRLRGAGSQVARGFFNDFDAEGPHESAPQETIQFLVLEGEPVAGAALLAARYAVQISAKYRPRLEEIETELKRRLGDSADLTSLDGAARATRYTSAELHDFAYRRAALRRNGRTAPFAIILPINKTADWWAQPALNRHAYFYPHVDVVSGSPVPGHALSASDGVATIYRRLFHNPDGYQRDGEYDFLTYFECEPEHLDTFARVHKALRDADKNPEWRFVREGPLWRGRRVLRW
jgi:hypothetical protein